MTALLAVDGLEAGYHGHPVISDISLRVDAGEIVAVLGPNGAGKTTTLLTIAGDLPLLGGGVKLGGSAVKSPLHRRVKEHDIGLVTEERAVFMRLTVADNLRVGRCDVGKVLELFPELEPLLDRPAGLLSGGEQQMLSVGRALARGSRLLLIDELSLGLAPLVVERLLEALRRAADDDGVGVLVVEQHVRKALRFADRVYVLRRGQLVAEGTSTEISARLSEVEDHYLVEGSEQL